MEFKGIYKQKSSLSKAGILSLLFLLSIVLHVLIFIVIAFLFEGNISLIKNQDLTSQTTVNYLKLIQLLTGSALFIAPMLFYAYLIDFDLRFKVISRQSIILVITIMMLVTPFVGLLLEWNMKINFPDWLLGFDKNSELIIEAFLQMNSFWDLLYTLLVIAVVPAIWEELIFRGYLQKITASWLKNPHVSILIIAFLFSVIHLHFQGIIPRFFLGALLGYLYYWSSNLWLPILAHFVNNAQAIIFSYPLFKTKTEFLFSEHNTDPMIGLFSFFAVGLLLFLLYKNLSIKKT